jgi:WD40 repeat protein
MTFELAQRSVTLDDAQGSTVATCCTFNHNGQLLVAGCSDGVVRIFDLRRSDCIDSWTAHQGEALAIQLTADFTACYSLGSDGKASDLTICVPLTVLAVPRKSGNY